MRSRIHTTRALGALLLALAACGGGGDDDGGDDGAGPDADTPDHAVLRRASKSGTIAMTGNDAYVVMVNPETDSVSVFDATTGARTAVAITGDEPSAVVIHPDDTTFFVANRADATVVKVTGIDSSTPDVGDTVDVGSEPTGLALSPSGARLYVAEWAEGRIAVIDTATMTEIGAIEAPVNPRAVAVTNDGDQDDGDELIVVPEFYGDVAGTEGSDTSRAGRVRLYSASDLSPQDPIVFAPIDSGFAPLGATDQTTVMTSPNQLWAAIVIGQKIYLPSVSASPAPPIQFQTNVQPVVYVGDLATHAEDRGVNGTMNLARLVRDQVPQDTARFFLADIVDIGFVGDKVMYALSRGGDVLQRVALEDDGPQAGSTQNFQIDLNVVPSGSTQRCQTPTGVVIGYDTNKAFINCWATRQLGVVDFAAQALVQTVESAPIAVSEVDAQNGRRFFFTARGRWANNAWSDCGSCHPDGLSDNITWFFAAGPRQTTSMDGSFSHFPGAPQKQRVLNWTGIFDEIHDFERNTRDVSGGLGAITRAAANDGACGNPATEERIDPLPGNLAGATAALQDCTTDWDDIEAYVKTIRPPRAVRRVDSASVERGRALFAAGADGAGCVKCHGGAGWTSSRLYADPQLANDAFAQPGVWPGAAAGVFRWNFHPTLVANQPGTTVFGNDAPEVNAIAPGQVACTIRNVGTFGDAALEVKAFPVNGTPGARAQGRLGYNVPSLYGLALGAPYLHHGGAATLEELFDDPAWEQHATAGNPNWLAGDPGTVAQRKADLIAFLRSIDSDEVEQAIPAGFDGCPVQQ
jgi:YVTN family beta-propeller protein